MRARNLALGGSLDNAVVFQDGKPLNPEGLRFDDEWVRHKALDCAGDLSLAGSDSCAVLHGHFIGIRPGHAINNLLLRELFKDPAAYEIA